MNLITKPLNWAHALTPFRQRVKYLVLHHEAGNGTFESTHAYHKSLGWAGIAYHLYVTKDGKIYAGRPMDMQGGHCKGYNGISVGICFQGNFEQDKMGAAQIRAGEDAIRYALSFYPDMKIVGHKELVATACPGAHFPLEHFKSITLEDESMTGEEIYRKLYEYLAEKPAPDWAQQELQAAMDMGITDGAAPMTLIPRYQAAMMAKRAAEAALRKG